MLTLASPNEVLPGPSFWISLRYFAITRMLVAILVLGALFLPGGGSGLGEANPQLFLRTAAAYGVLGALFVYLSVARPTRFYFQLVGQLTLDLVAITLMMHAGGGLRGGMAVLYLLPIAGAAILSPPEPAAGFAAASTIAILGETLLDALHDPSTVNSGTTLLAGLYGAVCFAISVVINRLAARLITQQDLARVNREALERQVEINRLAVADMQDGVLILDEQGDPQALNPAAARMLRVADPQRLINQGWNEHVAGLQIHEHFQRWRHQDATAESFELVVGAADNDERDSATERVRGRFVSTASSRLAGGTVVFLEDLQRVDERAQQLKLASMGRFTASIAHEIRNPLAAISHAAALLAESAAEGDRRLLHIIQDNARRLDRIIENILQLSRRGPVHTEPVQLLPFLNEAVEEFCRDQPCDTSLVDVAIYGQPIVHFNREHLRQVIVNLLQNAARHASGAPASVSIIVVPVVPTDLTLLRTTGAGVARHVERIEVIVQDDGAGIDGDTRRHLFEPFFTTHHKGTGLGLYLARELCLANGATLGYVPNADSSKKGGFVVNAAGTIREYAK